MAANPDNVKAEAATACRRSRNDGSRHSGKPCSSMEEGGTSSAALPRRTSKQNTSATVNSGAGAVCGRPPLSSLHHAVTAPRSRVASAAALALTLPSPHDLSPRAVLFTGATPWH